MHDSVKIAYRAFHPSVKAKPCFVDLGLATTCIAMQCSPPVPVFSPTAVLENFVRLVDTGSVYSINMTILLSKSTSLDMLMYFLVNVWRAHCAIPS